MNEFKYRYSTHKASAVQRGITFRISFKDWKRIWLESGHWHARGCRKGQYVMARFADKGPYVVGNVKIVRQETNHREARPNQRYTEAGRRSLSERGRGTNNGLAKLDENKVKQIRADPRSFRWSLNLTALAKEYGVTIQTVSAVVHRHTWKHVK